MSIRLGITLGFAFLLLLVSWEAYSQWRGRLLAQGELLARSEEYDSLFAATMDRDAALAELNLQAQAQAETQLRQEDSLKALSARGTRVRVEYIDRAVAAAGPDSAVVRQAVTQVVDSIERLELSPLRQALIRADSLVGLRERQLARQEEVGANLGHALAEANALLGLQKRAGPRPLVQGGKTLLVLGAGVALGHFIL